MRGTNDAGRAMRRAAVMAQLELFDADGVEAAPCELKKCGAAGGAEADHRDGACGHLKLSSSKFGSTEAGSTPSLSVKDSGR